MEMPMFFINGSTSDSIRDQLAKTNNEDFQDSSLHAYRCCRR